jgi:uncharacterized membrane protein
VKVKKKKRTGPAPAKKSRKTGARGGRLGILDELRGLAIVNMIAYHLCYDLVVLYDVDWPWFYGKQAGIWQEGIAVSFLFIAGICTAYTRRPYARVLRIGACALLITAATRLLYPDQFIVFGILHCMGASMLVYALARGAFARTPGWAGFLACLLLICATWNVVHGFVGAGAFSLELPAALYTTDFLFPLGLRNAAFRSADYFPLLPYLFVFLAGGFAGRWTRNLPAFIRREHIRPLAFLGRHSLLIYMLHQPALMGIVYALSAAGLI